MSVKLLTEHHLEFLNLKLGYTDSSKSTLVKIPHCWKSHVTAQIFRPQDPPSSCVCMFNLFMLNVFCHPYQLNESISNFRFVRWYFSFHLKFKKKRKQRFLAIGNVVLI